MQLRLRKSPSPPQPPLSPHFRCCPEDLHASLLQLLSTFLLTLKLTVVVSLQGEGASSCLPPTLDPTVMRVHPQGWDQDGMLRLMARSVPASQSPGVLPAVFWAAGFSFSRAQLITEVTCYLWSPPPDSYQFAILANPPPRPPPPPTPCKASCSPQMCLPVADAKGLYSHCIANADSSSPVLPYIPILSTAEMYRGRQHGTCCHDISCRVMQYLMLGLGSQRPSMCLVSAGAV